MVRFEISTAALLALTTTRARFVARADGVAGTTTTITTAPKHDPFDPFVPRNLLTQQEQQRNEYRSRLLDATTTRTTLDTSSVVFDGGFIDIDPLNAVEAVVADVGILSNRPCSGIDRPVINSTVPIRVLVYDCLEDGGFRYGYDCSKMSCWNMSMVTNLTYAFGMASTFNEPLYWDTSNVEDMTAAFYGASSFNQNLDHWDVSSVRDMSEMFYGTNAFDLPLDSWQTDSLETTSKMFYYAEKFDHPIESWNMGKVTDTSRMFSGAEKFDQPLAGWDVSNLENTVEMFYRAGEFNQPLNDWDVSSVTDMSGMFYLAKKFTQCLARWKGKKTLSNATTVLLLNNVFKKSGCSIDDDPDSNSLSWCVAFEEGCTPWHPCGNNPDPFEKVSSSGEIKNFSCTEIAEGSRRIGRVCDNDAWQTNCPGLCNVGGECECEDFEHRFVPNRGDGDDDEDEDEDTAGTTCNTIGARACRKKKLQGVCRGSCDKKCRRKRRRKKTKG